MSTTSSRKAKRPTLPCSIREYENMLEFQAYIMVAGDLLIAACKKYRFDIKDVIGAKIDRAEILHYDEHNIIAIQKDSASCITELQEKHPNHRILYLSFRKCEFTLHTVSKHSRALKLVFEQDLEHQTGKRCSRLFEILCSWVRHAASSIRASNQPVKRRIRPKPRLLKAAPRALSRNSQNVAQLPLSKLRIVDNVEHEPSEEDLMAIDQENLVPQELQLEREQKSVRTTTGQIEVEQSEDAPL